MAQSFSGAYHLVQQQMRGGAVGGTDPGSVWTPSSITPDLWIDPSDLTTMFQNSNGTTAVTTDGNPVGYITNKGSAGGSFTMSVSGWRPTYKTSGGLSWLEFDGVNMFLQNASFNMDADAWDSVIGMRPITTTSSFNTGNNRRYNDCTFGPATAGNWGIGSIYESGGTKTICFFAVSGGSVKERETSGVVLGTDYIHSARHISGTIYEQLNQGTVHSIACGTLDGSVTGGTNIARTGDGAGTCANVRFYGIVGKKADISSDRASLQSWMAAKSGVTL